MITSHKPLATSKQGQVYVFTGDGKGKTSAAFWTGVRAALRGMKVAAIQWYKDPTWDVAEYRLPKILKKFQVYPMGEGFRITNYESRIMNREGKEVKLASVGTGRVVDTASEQEHKMAAREALNLAGKLIGKVEVLILDEVNNAVKDKLIDLVDLIDLISKRGKTHVILTGRDACAELVEAADLATEMKKIKHPFDQGKMAVKGLDF